MGTVKRSDKRYCVAILLIDALLEDGIA